jgi:hypothetical protein
MPEYVLDIVIDLVRTAPPYDSAGNAEKLYIKIDKNGNVDIKTQTISICSGRKNEYYQIYDVFVIKDNIPIPKYIIDMLIRLLPSVSCSYTGLYREHYYSVFESIKTLKKELKKMSSNPQNIDDMKILLDCLRKKNENLEKQIESMENKTQSLEKINSYTVNFNEKLKEENKKLLEKIDILEKKTKYYETNKQNINVKSASSYNTTSNVSNYTKPITQNRTVYSQNTSIYEPENTYYSLNEYSTETISLRDCWSNPGGASVYTKDNAQNRMIYNPDTGIYEPED